MNILIKDSKMILMIVNKIDFFLLVLGNIFFLCLVEFDVVVFFELFVVVCNVDFVLVVFEEIFLVFWLIDV